MLRNFYEKFASLDALLALLSGVLMALSFPKAEFSSFAFFSLIPLLYALHRPQKRLTALTCGMITGFVFFMGTLYWVTYTMENYGQIPKSLSLFILVVLSLYLSFYPGLFAWGVNRMQKTGIPLLIGAPSLWTALEYARGHLLTGFPWALLGYTQYKNLLMIQMADITGVYGVSFLLVMINTVFVMMLIGMRNSFSVRSFFSHWITPVVILGLSASYGAFRLHEIHSAEHKPWIRIGVVQGNIDQNRKWDAASREQIMAVHTRLTRRASQEKPDLILWPEASVPFFFMADKEYQSQILGLIDDLGVDILFGSPDYTVDQGVSRFYNSAFLVSPGARLKGKYDKIHLVPFGEYVPLRKALFFIKPIVDQIGDITPGNQITLMQAGEGLCGTPICFEIIFPDLVRKFVLKGADFIATLTNDDWFGRSSAPYQHFSMAVFRAVENRVPVVRSANSGISGVIAQDGRIVRQTDIFVEDAFTEDLSRLKTGKTFYTRFGDLFTFLCIAAAVSSLCGPWIRRRVRGKNFRDLTTPDSRD